MSEPPLVNPSLHWTVAQRIVTVLHRRGVVRRDVTIATGSARLTIGKRIPDEWPVIGSTLVDYLAAHRGDGHRRARTGVQVRCASRYEPGLRQPISCVLQILDGDSEVVPG